MAFNVLVIASVDENQDPSRLLSRGQDPVPSSRPIIYVSREQCVQHKLRNTVVALSFPGEATPERLPIYASVKIYSKESALFRKDTRFPERLTVRDSDHGFVKTWPVVVSNLLWWQIMQGPNKTFKEDLTMLADHTPIEFEVKVVNKLGSATTLVLAASDDSFQHTPVSSAISQSLSGFVASLHGWIMFRSQYGTQMFKITDITTTSTDHPNVAFISETTTVRHASLTNTLSDSSAPLSGPATKGILPKEDWLAAVRDRVGGYDDTLHQIIDLMYGYIESATVDSEDSMTGMATATTAWTNPCFRPPFKGILISGRPGTGKTVLASRLAESSGTPYAIINCPDVFQTDAGASENYLRDAFTTLLARGKVSILILDEVDMIASGRASRKGVEAKLFATLLHLVDSINIHPTGNKVIIIALTNRLHAVDPSLVRSGRLDKVFDLHLKGADQRLRVLEIVSKDLPMESEQRQTILRRVAMTTHGFVPTDLQSLCTECALLLISRMAAGTKEAVIDHSCFEQALKVVRPSGMSEFQSKIPAVTFNDLYGIHDAIADLRVSIIEPFHNPCKYIKMGISPPRGLLIHGPPGVGKTMLCCALAEELGINFMLVESSQIRSKVVGESEQNIARMFAQAKANSPCILFIDQIDILAPSRGSTHTSENSGDRIVTGLLTEMDGFFSTSSRKSAQVDVLVLAATNRPEVIDSAILRPGRLDQIVHIPAPDQKTRLAILEGYSSKMPIRICAEEMLQLANNTVGYSGADLENLCREAALICLREDIKNTVVNIMEVLYTATS
ncbi:MAG: P-loop containing nucleoside triphosphate hydrolase protein [Benniella sp.]|nr:MAG: P-loop containing nucleoside triphosphate hydrolase protein [Benniella sp.]